MFQQLAEADKDILRAGRAYMDSDEVDKVERFEFPHLVEYLGSHLPFLEGVRVALSHQHSCSCAVFGVLSFAAFCLVIATDDKVFEQELLALNQTTTITDIEAMMADISSVPYPTRRAEWITRYPNHEITQLIKRDNPQSNHTFESLLACLECMERLEKKLNN